NSSMTNISLHFPRSIDIPNNEEEPLFAPFGVQCTVDGKALLSLRISMCTDDDTTYLQYYDLDTKESSFCCLSYHLETHYMTDFTVVNERTILCGRFFDYAVIEFTDSSFSSISKCRRLGIDLSIDDEESLEISNRSFALGATVHGRYLYAAISDEEGVLSTGIKKFKVRRYNRNSVMDEMGEIVAESKGWTPMEVWQNGKIVVTNDGYIDLVSRDLCNLIVIRLRIDPKRPDDQVIDRSFLNINFTDEHHATEYAMGMSADPSQQHCETSPQSFIVGNSIVTCHPEGLFSHRLIRRRRNGRRKGMVKKQIVEKIMVSEGRLSSMCISPCGRFLFTVTIQTEHDPRAYGPEYFKEDWKCEKRAILDDEPSLENLARRSIVNSMGKEMRRDESICDILHNSPILARKIIYGL
ncbi:hypothetical protein PRIPAC_84023, partial [Pristionchus pacificus]